MNQIEKLASMGCGSEILNSCYERGAIQAAISNAKTFFKYCKNSVKSGLFATPADTFIYISSYYNELKNVEHLVSKYHALYQEDYSKLKLQIEKFFSL